MKPFHIIVSALTLSSAGAFAQVKSPVTTTQVRTAHSSELDTQRLAAQRNQAVQSLLKEVERLTKKPSPSLQESVQLESSVRLLGQYRAEQAAPILTENISRKTAGLMYEVRPFSYLPNVGALVDIGNPAIQEILRRLKPLTSDSPEYPQADLHLFAYIIRQVDGNEVGLYRLELASKEATGTHKINLLNLIDIYKLSETEAEIKQAIEH